MEPIFALVVGVLYGCAIYLLLRRSMLKLIIGLALLGHAANLLLFTSGDLVSGSVPFVPEGATAAPHTMADPVPQALILTAIVIGFGVLAFVIVLFRKLYTRTGTDDLYVLTTTEELEKTS